MGDEASQQPHEVKLQQGDDDDDDDVDQSINPSKRQSI